MDVYTRMYNYRVRDQYPLGFPPADTEDMPKTDLLHETRSCI